MHTRAVEVTGRPLRGRSDQYGVCASVLIRPRG